MQFDEISESLSSGQSDAMPKVVPEFLSTTGTEALHVI